MLIHLNSLESYLEDPTRKNKLIKRIAESVSNQTSSHLKENHPITCQTCNQKEYSKRIMERYLYTFAFQIGCDVPSENIVKSILLLLRNNEDDLEHSANKGLLQQEKNEKFEGDRIEAAKFYLLIQICLKLYVESKKNPIGGFFQRIMMNLKQNLYYDTHEEESNHKQEIKL